MGMTSVRMTVKEDFTREEHRISAGDYAGQENSRPDVNSAGGRKITYLLHAVVPQRQDDAVVTTSVDLDVTDLVASGQIEIA